MERLLQTSLCVIHDMHDKAVCGRLFLPFIFLVLCVRMHCADEIYFCWFVCRDWLSFTWRAYSPHSPRIKNVWTIIFERKKIKIAVFLKKNLKFNSVGFILQNPIASQCNSQCYKYKNCISSHATYVLQTTNNSTVSSGGSRNLVGAGANLRDAGVEIRFY